MIHRLSLTRPTVRDFERAIRFIDSQYGGRVAEYGWHSQATCSIGYLYRTPGSSRHSDRAGWIAWSASGASDIVFAEHIHLAIGFSREWPAPVIDFV